MTDADKTVFAMVRDSLQDCIDANTATDPVRRPAHYVLDVRGVEVECIDLIRALVADEKGEAAYYLGNCLKYLWRRKHKGSELQDLRKARQYLNWLIEHMEAECQRDT